MKAHARFRDGQLATSKISNP